MRQQSGTFTNASLNGISAFHMSGISGSGQGDAVLGLFTGSNGTATVDMYEDEGGTINSHSASCSYSVASNGRVTLSGVGCGGDPPILYLTAAKSGLMQNVGGVSNGAFEAQSAGPFSPSGTFFMGTNQVPVQVTEPSVGSVTLNAGTVSGTSDVTSTTFQGPNNTFTDSYTVSAAGWVTIGGDTTPTLLVISGNKMVKIDPSKSTDLYPMLLIMEK
jgi:hypothetical protein